MTNPKNARLPDLSVREWAVLAPLLILIGLMGLVPQPFLDPAKPAVDRLLTRFTAAEQRLREQDPARPPTTGSQPPAFAAAGAQPPAFAGRK